MQTWITRNDIAKLASPATSKTKGFLSLDTMRSYEIDEIFVSVINKAGDRTRDLFSYYCDSRNTQEDMI